MGAAGALGAAADLVSLLEEEAVSLVEEDDDLAESLLDAESALDVELLLDLLSLSLEDFCLVWL